MSIISFKKLVYPVSKKFGKYRYIFIIFFLMFVTSILGDILSIEENIKDKIFFILGGILLPLILLLGSYKDYYEEKKDILFKNTSEKHKYLIGYYLAIPIFFLMFIGGIVSIFIK